MKPTRLLLALTLVTGAVLRADDPGHHATAKFSAPDKPEIVRILVRNGSVHVKGTDSADTVTVESSEPSDKSAEQRSDGLRVLSSSASFNLGEKDNVIELSYGRDEFMNMESGSFTVMVPIRASVEITEGWNTDIVVQNLSGDLTVKAISGAIRVDQLSGGASIETMNGEIHAAFSSVPTGRPLSFTSMNGRIELHLPAETKANVRLRTQNGSILTDFPEDALKTKSVAMPGDERGESARAATDVARDAVRMAKAVADEVRDAVDAAADEARAEADAMKAEKEAEENDAKDSKNHNNPDHHPRHVSTHGHWGQIPSIPSIVGGKVVSGILNGGGTDIQAATMNGDIIVRKGS